MSAQSLAIAGVGETPFVRRSEHSLIELVAAASRRAMADAGLEPRDIDGYIQCNADVQVDELAYALGIGLPEFSAAITAAAGAGTVGNALQLARLAIESGRTRHVLVSYGLKCSKPGGPRTIHASEPLKLDLEMPVGYFGQPIYYAMIANRYRHEHGMTEEEHAAVAISTRAWATLTPGAQMREPLTYEAYQRSPVIAAPMRVADCCLMTDGAGAYVVTSVERARDLPHPPVVIAGLAMGTTPLPMSMIFSQTPDLLSLPGRAAVRQAYAMAGVAAADLDFAQIYDCFSMSAIIQAEMLGLCETGAGAHFFHAGHAAPGGRHPINTSGGHMSGGFLPGVNLLVEGVRQIRGERGDAQIPGACIGAVTGLGGNTHCTAILTKDQ